MSRCRRPAIVRTMTRAAKTRERNANRKGRKRWRRRRAGTDAHTAAGAIPWSGPPFLRRENHRPHRIAGDSDGEVRPPATKPKNLSLSARADPLSTLRHLLAPANAWVREGTRTMGGLRRETGVTSGAGPGGHVSLPVLGSVPSSSLAIRASSSFSHESLQLQPRHTRGSAYLQRSHVRRAVTHARNRRPRFFLSLKKN